MRHAEAFRIATEMIGSMREEWRVVHMDAEFGFDRTSAGYPARELAEQVQSGRGGTLQRRLVAETEWEDHR